jgi:hypothetical protein
MRTSIRREGTMGARRADPARGCTAARSHLAQRRCVALVSVQLATCLIDGTPLLPDHRVPLRQRSLHLPSMPRGCEQLDTGPVEGFEMEAGDS